jgi:cation transport ATPase
MKAGLSILNPFSYLSNDGNSYTINRNSMGGSLSEKKLLIISIIIALYFLSLYVVYIFKVDFYFVGFLGELLTIPFMIAQLVFLFLGIRLWRQRRPNKNYLILISILLLSVCSILTLGSFLV